MPQRAGSTSQRQTQCAPLDPKKWLGFTLGQSQCVAPENCGFPSQEIDLRPESWPAFSKKPGGPRLKVGLVFEPEIRAGFCARKLVGAYLKNKRRPFSGQVFEPRKRARFQARKTAPLQPTNGVARPTECGTRRGGYDRLKIHGLAQKSGALASATAPTRNQIRL